MKTNNGFLTTMLTSTALVTMLSANAGAVKAVPSTHKLYVNNQLTDIAAYNIEGNNYFKLRDIAKLVGFGVAYDPQVNCVTLTSNQPYKDDGSGGVKTTIQATDLLTEYSYDEDTLEAFQQIVGGRIHWARDCH